MYERFVTGGFLVAAVLMFGLACAESVTWTTDEDFSAGSHHDTQNESGNLMLNDTDGTYDASGYFVSDSFVTYDPVESVVPSWSADEPNENVNVTIEVSVDGGDNFCLASNGVIIDSEDCAGAGFGETGEVVFRANFSTNDTTQTAALHDITITYTMVVPRLEVGIILPLDNTVVGKDRIMFINASVVCRDADCGLVNATARYNATSSVPDAAIDTTAGGVPLYVVSGINVKNCTDEYLTAGEMCNVSWVVNVTGDLEEAYEIDVVFESNRSTVGTNDTSDVTIEIGRILIINVEFDEIDFGLLDPGATDEPALSNEWGYNISIDVNSNDVENMWIKGTNLTIDDDTGLNCEPADQYNRYDGNTTSYPCLINVTNIMWSLEAEPSAPEKYELTGNFERMNKDMQVFESGSRFSTFYWIDVPYGIYAGGYTGTITFMANATW